MNQTSRCAKDFADFADVVEGVLICHILMRNECVGLILH